MPRSPDPCSYFFELAVPECEIGHVFVELQRFPTQSPDLVKRRRPNGVAREECLAGRQERPRTAIMHQGGASFATVGLDMALVTTPVTENDPEILFSRRLTPAPSSILSS